MRAPASSGDLPQTMNALNVLARIAEAQVEPRRIHSMTDDALEHAFAIRRGTERADDLRLPAAARVRLAERHAPTLPYLAIAYKPSGPSYSAEKSAPSSFKTSSTLPGLQ